MDLNGCKVLVSGMARSGLGAALLCRRLGAQVTVQDLKKEEELTDQLAVLQTGEGAYPFSYIWGRNPSEEEAKGFDYVILSPGVPTDLPFVQIAAENGIPVWSEIELASRICKSPIIGITGTNGKTTTTTLVGEIMKAYLPASQVAGNIGTAFSEIVEDSSPEGYTVLELSSFQLETIETFHPHVSAILNFTPDHLNRHKTFENYVAAKCRVYENQTAEDICVLNYDDPLCRERAEEIQKSENGPKLILFSRKVANCGQTMETAQRPVQSLWTEDGMIYYGDGHNAPQKVAELSRMIIFGPHNEENAMAAVGCCLAAGVPLTVIEEGLYAFKGVAHRIEYVGTVDEVNYYNDSKATNPDAAIKGLLAMKSEQTVLLGGGYDKGTPYDEWCVLFNGRVRKLILIGATREDIYRSAVACGYPAEQIVMKDTFEEAVEEARLSAKPGDSVLLSPACASWGMFDNYEQRGDIFRDLVQKMKSDRR